MPPSRHEFELDNGTKFYIRRFDVFLSMKILGDIQKKFLAPIAQFVEANDRSLPQEVRDKNMTEAIDKISRNLDGDSLIELTRKVLNPEFISVVIEGEPAAKLEEHLLNRATDGSIFDVVALIFEVLKVNYEELFTRGRTLIGKAQLASEAIH
jgi:hypothetical protein